MRMIFLIVDILIKKKSYMKKSTFNWCNIIHNSFWATIINKSGVLLSTQKISICHVNSLIENNAIFYYNLGSNKLKDKNFEDQHLFHKSNKNQSLR